MHKKLSKYQILLYNWLDQYHRSYPELRDVIHKLKYLKEKLTGYKNRDSIESQVRKAA